MTELLETIKTDLPKFRSRFIFLDYDGTLVPFVDDVSQAFLSEENRDLIKQLCSLPNTYVGIVTGRSLKDIKTFIDIPELIYVTNHGYLVENRGFSTSFNSKFTNERNYLDRCQRILNQLKEFPLIQMEFKELSASFHYRRVPDQLKELCRKKLLQIIKTFFAPKEALIFEGKHVVEVLPFGNCNKGSGIKFVLEKFQKESGQNDCFAIFIGDDLTDEDGFKYLNSLNKITIKVSTGETVAKFRLENTQAITQLLKDLIGLLEKN